MQDTTKPSGNFWTSFTGILVGFGGLLAGLAALLTVIWDILKEPSGETLYIERVEYGIPPYRNNAVLLTDEVKRECERQNTPASCRLKIGNGLAKIDPAPNRNKKFEIHWGCLVKGSNLRMEMPIRENENNWAVMECRP